MPNVRETMAKMTCHGSNPGAVGRSKPELSAHDVAAALGMAHLDLVGESILLAKYCGDGNAARKLRKIWIDPVYEIVMRRNGRPPPKGVLTVLAWASVYQFLHPNVCRKCGGVASLVINSKKVDCPTCKGSGKRYVSMTSLAKAAQMPETTWRAWNFRPVLDESMARLQSLEDIAASWVWETLKNDRQKG